MAESKSPQYIDGFSSVQAVKHHGQRKGRKKPEKKPPPTPAPERKTDATSKGTRQTRIGHTVRPKSYQIECFNCGYSFKLTGRLSKVFCPKCREALEVDDYVVESGEEWSRDIKTIGRVEVKKGATIRNARILARELALGGRIEESSGYIFGFMELRQGGSFELGDLRVNDIRVSAGCSLSLRRQLECDNLTVQGDIKGRFKIHNRVTVRSGGCLRGNVTAPRLVVEDGGGLKARMKIINTDRDSKAKT